MTTAANAEAIAALQADLALLKGNHTALVSHVDGGFVAVHDLDVAWLVICGEARGCPSRVSCARGAAVHQCWGPCACCRPRTSCQLAN